MPATGKVSRQRVVLLNPSSDTGKAQLDKPDETSMHQAPPRLGWTPMPARHPPVDIADARISAGIWALVADPSR
jgi:hypothetical protein